MDFLEACENGNEERVVELLLEADLNAQTTVLSQTDLAGRCGLHSACIGGQLTVIRLLLGRECQVFFPSRDVEQTETLLEKCGKDIHVVMKRKEDTHVPCAVFVLPAHVCVKFSDLASGRKYTDDYGNAPIQCISCFGCGNERKHIREGLEIARELLRAGCQSNTSKTNNHWTPLHWCAFNGNHELTALLLNPQDAYESGRYPTAQQYAIPLTVSESLYPVDVAGRMGMKLADEMAALRKAETLVESGAVIDDDIFEADYREWRLHLDHVLVVEVFVADYVSQADRIHNYVMILNDRRTSTRMSGVQSRRFTVDDIIRYGQHLLYWCSGLNMGAQVAVLLTISLEKGTDRSRGSSLSPLYPVQYDESKSQSALHFACAMGHTDIVQLLLMHVISQYDSSGAKPTTTSKVYPVNTTIQDKHASASEIPFAALTGWLNYRQETPLFLATLYNRSQVAKDLLEILPHQHMQIELSLRNIEGSSLLETANDSVREVLGLPTDSSYPMEYVVVFRRRHADFRKTLQDVLEEESSRAPSLLSQFAGTRVVGGFLGDTFDYLAVGAIESVLSQKAETLKLMIRKRGTSQLKPFDASEKILYEPFRSLHRQLIVLHLIRDNINLKRHVKKKSIHDIFPLHDQIGYSTISNHWIWKRKHWRIQPWHSMGQYLMEGPMYSYEVLWPLRNYFGDKYTLYVAWMQFFTAYMSVISIPCIVIEFVGLMDYPSTIPPLVLLLLVWITYMVEMWKRKKSEILCKWGVSLASNEASTLTDEFHGDFVVDTTTNERDVRFPDSLRIMRVYLGLPILLAMVGLAVLMFVVIRLLSANNVDSNEVSYLYKPALSALNAIVIIILDMLYTKVAFVLTYWENHRTVREFESMLAIKLFWFKFINAFLSLFWTAFVDRSFSQLRMDVFMILGCRLASSIFISKLLPLLYVRQRWHRAGYRMQSLFDLNLPDQDVWNDEITVPVGILMQEMMTTPVHVLDKQIDAMIRFGYVTMFATVFPGAPMLVALGNIIDIHLDIQTSLEAQRRPSLDGETEVQVFMSILEFMSFAAVSVNCGLLYQSNHMDAYLTDPTDWTAKLSILLIIEHAVLAIKAGLALGISDTPSWVDSYYAKLDNLNAIKAPEVPVIIAPRQELQLNSDEIVENFSAPEEGDCALPPSSSEIIESTSSKDLETPKIHTEVHERQNLEAQIIALQQSLAAVTIARDMALSRMRRLENDQGGIPTCTYCDLNTPSEVKCLECKTSMCIPCDARQHSGLIAHTRIDSRLVGKAEQDRVQYIQQLLRGPKEELLPIQAPHVDHIVPRLGTLSLDTG